MNYEQLTVNYKRSF